MVKLQYSRPAITDLQNIFVYISNDSVINARRFVHSLKERIKTLKIYPEMGKPVFPERFPYVRQVLYKSYRVIYKFEKDTVTILVVTHQEKLIENIEAIKPYLI